ncbi:HIT-like domain-containing protein [Zopfochytrium polystomum]|nr:HIT-like domain-containing protein [Zopfochytrium polystomum]
MGIAGIVATAAAIGAVGYGLLVLRRRRRDAFAANCIFCKIVAGQVPARIAFRDDRVTVFHDIHPASRVHLLVVPNRHIADLNGLVAGGDDGDDALLEHMGAIGAAQAAAALAALDSSSTATTASSSSSSSSAYVLQFTRPPFTSVDHLHLHAVSAPIASPLFNALAPWLGVTHEEAVEALRAKGRSAARRKEE